MWTEDYRWHYDYVRLAWDTGFSFEKYKHPNVDKNKMCLVDIECIIKERDIASVERCIPFILQYILENDQTELLDTNFIKVFRLCQLSVEYLLFCKKYLDNTVVLLKKEVTKLKEDNKELKSFSEDLESHIATLTKQNNFLTSFKCIMCLKSFSTEEYLSSHMKRRHSDMSNIPTNIDTDKLQSELKMLKERLNNTEKLLHDKNEKIDEKEKIDNEVKVKEMQDTFDKFKEQVENDIKNLHIEKRYYEEKCSKLFDLVFNSSNKENLNPSMHQRDKNSDIIEYSKTTVETTTQTEWENNVTSKVLEMETFQNKSVDEYKNFDSTLKTISSEKNMIINKELDEKMNKFEETITHKISTSLDNIKCEMTTFCEKLTAYELNRNKSLNHLEEQIKDKQIKPKIKPRTKIIKPSTIAASDVQKIVTKSESDLIKNLHKPVVVISSNKAPRKRSQLEVIKSATLPSSESENISESTDFEEVSEKYQKKRSLLGSKKPARKSFTGKVQSKEYFNKVHEELRTIMDSKLQEIGISPDWPGIPRKTFERAQQIVVHQANLTKRSYENFEIIKNDIEKSLRLHKDLKMLLTKSTYSPMESISKARSVTDDQTISNVINVLYRKQSKTQEPKLESKSSAVTIKNRSIYDTDTENELLQPTVIEEAKVLLTNDFKNCQDIESDLSSAKMPNEDKKENQTKSALKNYPITGTITKKKVLFEIKDDAKKDNAIKEDAQIMQVEGSTTSVASSVLDGPILTDLREKDSSLSDFGL